MKAKFSAAEVEVFVEAVEKFDDEHLIDMWLSFMTGKPVGDILKKAHTATLWNMFEKRLGHAARGAILNRLSPMMSELTLKKAKDEWSKAREEGEM